MESLLLKSCQIVPLKKPSDLCFVVVNGAIIIAARPVWNTTWWWPSKPICKHTHTHTQRWCEFSTPSPISGPRQYFFHPFTDRQCYIVWEIIYYVSVKLSTIPMLFSILIIKKKTFALNKPIHFFHV